MKDYTLKGYLFLGVLILICLLCIIPAIAETSENYWAPYVTKTTTNTATINWRQTTQDAATIEYANSSYYSQYHIFDKKITSPKGSKYNHIQLNDLEPNTSYKYLVKPSGKRNVFDIRSFRTMPLSGPFTFIVISDSQQGHNYGEEQRFKYVADAIANESDVLFILHGGDNAGFDEFMNWTKYFNVADGMLANSAIFSTIGNHEYHNASGGDNPPTAADHYRIAYDMPLNYSFDCAGIRFISLNSPDPNHSNGDDPHTSLALAKSQESWLKDQLDNNMLGTFTIHHHPIWDLGRTAINSDLKPWETLYHTYNISATFAGHTHNYQRYLVNGTPYFVVGNGGGRFSDLTGPKAAGYQFGSTRRLGYLKVSVDPTNNTATAQSTIAASVIANDDNETPQVYNPPVVDDTFSFNLKPLDISLPRLDDINPTSGSPGSSIFMSINGSGFKFVPSVTFTRNTTSEKRAEESFAATDVTVLSSSKLTCIITIPIDATVGSYTVNVKNANGQKGSLKNAFSVISRPPLFIRSNSPTIVTKKVGETTGYTMNITGISIKPGANFIISDVNKRYSNNILGPWTLQVNADGTFAKTIDNAFKPNLSWRTAVYNLTIINPDRQFAIRPYALTVNSRREPGVSETTVIKPFLSDRKQIGEIVKSIGGKNPLNWRGSFNMIKF